MINFEHQADDLGVTCLQDLKLDTLGRDSKILEATVKELNGSANNADEADSKGGRVKYTDIRGKFPHLFNKDGSNGEKNDDSQNNRTVPVFQEQDNSVDKPNVAEEDGSQSPPDLEKTPSSSSIQSRTNLTENDPLGALTTPEISPVQDAAVLTKSATLPPSSGSNAASKPGDDILGTPFSEEKLSRSSSTLPSSDKTVPSTPANSGASMSYIRSLTKSAGVSSRLSSLKKVSSYLSPNPTTSKKTAEALSQGLASMKTAYSSAATLVGKRVEEIRESVQPGTPPVVSPAGSYQYLSTPDGHHGRRPDDDSLSNCSGAGESRRPSAIDQAAHLWGAEGTVDSWSSLTGALWDQFWGTERPGSNKPVPMLKATDITEQFESLYAKMPKRLPGPEAMQVQMTSCSRCLYCHAILYDEEIMAGWTAEDSNLNTKCIFCQKLMVPFLTIRAIDFRNRPCPTAAEGANSEEDKESNSSSNVHPTISEHITVPYLSPLVLRKELESVLSSEGDRCLLDPGCVSTHPIIFWNLIWIFERIAVKSHLPGFCLKAESLSRNLDSGVHPSWKSADHRNVYIKCRWDNERLHDPRDPPLYTLWKHHNVSKLNFLIN